MVTLAGNASVFWPSVPKVASDPDSERNAPTGMSFDLFPQPAPESALAGPGHVAGEVRVAPPGEHLGDARVDLRALPGQNEELLGVPAHRLLYLAVDLVGFVKVGLVGLEGAVLAVALARPRERERVVARKGDPAAHGASEVYGPDASLETRSAPSRFIRDRGTTWSKPASRARSRTSGSTWL